MADTEIIDQPETNEGITVPGEAAPAPQEQIGGHDSPADIEARARAMGWRPKEEFRGPEDKWRPADEFVKRGESELPILRERLQDMTRRQMESDAKREADIARLEKMAITALQRQRAELDAQYQAAMRNAVANADTERYDQLNRDRQQAVSTFDNQIREAAQPKQPAQPEAERVVVDSWVQSNQWFARDQMLARVAEARLTELQKEAPGRSLNENLQLVSSYVADKFPEKFGRQPRATASAAQPSMVEGGSRLSSGSGPRQKGASDLPADVRKVGEKFVAQGLYKNLTEYARDYFEQD